MKDKLEAYLQYLRREERSRATRQQYRRDILRFLAFLGESQLTKEQVIEYKERLQRVYQPASVNAKAGCRQRLFDVSWAAAVARQTVKNSKKALLPAGKGVEQGGI